MKTKLNSKPFVKVVHGEYVENPTCSMCGSRIKHEWLAGDYTLLICQSAECYDKWTALKEDERIAYRNGLMKTKIDNAVSEVMSIFLGKKEDKN